MRPLPDAGLSKQSGQPNKTQRHQACLTVKNKPVVTGCLLTAGFND